MPEPSSPFVHRGADVPLPERCVHDLFAACAAAAPDAVAVRAGDRQIGYGELDRRANQFAHRLREHGVRTEDPVALYLDRGIELLVAMLGIVKAGAYYVPLDPGYPAERLAFMVADAGVTVAVTRDGPAAAALVADPLVVDLTELAASGLPTTAPDVPLSPDNLIYTMYTSGSTGRPKGVQVTHRGVVRLVHGTDYADLGPGEVLLLLTSLCFDVSTFEIWGALANGATLAVLPPGMPTAAAIARAVHEFGVTLMWLTSGLFQHVVQADPAAVAGVRHLIVGGDVVPPAAVRQVLDAHDVEISNGYGPTECTTFALAHRGITRADTAGSIPIGRPIANTHLMVADDDLRPTGLGELLLGGPGVARGYLGRPALTAERFVPDPTVPGGRLYRTGDLVEVRTDGLIAYHGRLDHQVKIRGFRVEPGEIEVALRGAPGVGGAVVGTYPAPGGDHALVAWVTAGAEPPAAEALRAHLATTLPDHMLPAAWVFLEEFPLTPNGKVDRGALPAPAGAGEVPCTAPRTAVEEAVAQVWQEVLGVDRVGADQDFFAHLGGHSLLAAQVGALLAERFPVELPLTTIFEASTVAQLAAELEQAVLEHVATLSDSDVAGQLRAG